MGKNWMRKYTLKCGVQGGSGFEIGGSSGEDKEALHISFSVEKSDSESSNTAKVQIWNLSPENISILEQKDCIVELKAGYEGGTATILVGNITAVTTTTDNADRLTELDVVDGRVVLRDTYLSISMNGTVDTKKLYDTIAEQMGVSITYAEELKFVTIAEGFAFAGKAVTALTKIAGCNGHAWTLQNGVLQITYPGRPIAVQGYEISVDTGLVDIPKKISISSSGSTNEALSGYEIIYLMNGAIGVNDVISLKSKQVNGYFRIYKLTITGDNMEGDWICTAQALQIAQQPQAAS